MKISYLDFQKLKANFDRPIEIEILTGSMSPFISPGQKIIVFPLGDKKLKKFDPIVYWGSEKLICHFYYGEKTEGKKRYIRAKALNGSKEDPPFESEKVLGVVVRPTLPRWKRFFLRLLK